MRNKGFIIFLTVLITGLCLYYLSFTLVSRKVQNNAIEFATDEVGNIDFFKKQQYLDSISKEVVYNFLGIKFTYNEVQNTELSLGLDLQGGMHVTLEVSPVEIVKGLSGNSQDRNFLAAIDAAKKRSITSQEKFTTMFYEEYKKLEPQGRLSAIFANAANRGRISYETSDAEILKIVDAEVEDAIDRSFQILRTRIDRFGTSNPNIQKLPGSGRIQVELPGVDNPERVRKLLQGVAMLEFLEVYDLQELGASLEAINSKLVEEEKLKKGSTPKAAAEESEKKDDLSALLEGAESSTEEAAEGSTEEDLLENLDNTQLSPLFALSRGGFGLVYEVKDTATINKIINRADIKAMMPQNIRFAWSVKPEKVNTGQELLELYVLRTLRGNKAPLTGEVITDARQDFDQGKASVSMQMNAQGARAWRKLTSENIQRRVAIVLDNYVYSAPVVQVEIPNGNSTISGNFTLEEAKDLANVLKAGALPAPTRIVEEAIIGPTLGKEAQKQGVVSIIAGLALVVIFMIAYYSKGGLVANLALFFNVFFILGILAQLSAALTLPGIAGIVLTIGMAIDANVLIFERIKEELANGAKLKQAISTGYQKAYSAIFDSNLTTLLTGVILYTLGQGPVKGFAITLIIGIICSFFSAVFITRVVVERITRKGDESNVSFDTPLSRNIMKGFNFDFLSKRKLAYTISGLFIGLGMLTIVLQGGLNLGVDFTGGRSYVVQFAEPVPASDMKANLAEAFEGSSIEAKTYGANNILKITTSYLINDDSDDADDNVEKALIGGITEKYGLSYVKEGEVFGDGNFSIISSAKVGATIADDIKNSSQQSIIFSLVIIFLYIFVRFRKWQFGLGAVVALFHDVLAVLSAFAFARALGFSFEVDQVFIAAMLTLIGYSINDTVIVFDRIRETLSLKSRSASILATMNEAINNTLSRTFVTSFTTLVVVLILFIFGGEVLKGFSFALVVGILIGTYSSIFIASPVVIDFTKQEAKKEDKAAKSKA